MDADRTIIGAGVASAALIFGNAAVSGVDVGRRLVGVLVATMLLAGLAAVGAGAIARLFALLMVIIILFADGLALIRALGEV